jgi:hypothetical protein
VHGGGGDGRRGGGEKGEGKNYIFSFEYMLLLKQSLFGDDLHIITCAFTSVC